VAIGLAVMLVSFLILGGFQHTIKEKIFSFGAHLQVTKYTLGNQFEEQPISKKSNFYQNYQDYNFINHVQEFSHKPGLLKTDEDVWGVLLKGVGKNFNIERFNQNIIEGRFLNLPDSGYSREIMVSQRIANLLRLKVGDDVIMYFVQDPPRYRKLSISGIYKTDLEDFDEKIIIGDIGLIQRLNNWDEDLVGGFEVFLNDYRRMDQAEEVLMDEVDYDLYVEKVSDKYIQIFEWLSLLNKNVVIFLTLILFVACFNMISILLILIMERTRMIGMLKALGATNGQVRRIFVYDGMQLIYKGLLLGNLLALGFGFLQDKFKIIPLDPENYYMNFVPIQWNWPILILLNILVFVIVSLILLVPTMIIAKINPIKAIQFD
ncbi:MAG: FtsX-like permease family protein, partial [Bacteroidota bacterium]|nr:FtsX-like permease family protein [Bacteroidota bacterium]